MFSASVSSASARTGEDGTAADLDRAADQRTSTDGAAAGDRTVLQVAWELFLAVDGEAVAAALEDRTELAGSSAALATVVVELVGV